QTMAARVLLPPLIDRIDEWNQNPDGMRGLPTGFIDFDRKTGGLRPGDLVIVAGRPSMGKTTLAVNMAENAALDVKTAASVVIFSMEMPSEQLLMRMMSSLARVPLGSIRGGRMSPDDWTRPAAQARARSGSGRGGLSTAHAGAGYSGEPRHGDRRDLAWAEGARQGA